MRIAHDQLARQGLREVPTAFGSVHVEQEVAGEGAFLDVWMVPGAGRSALGLLARLVARPGRSSIRG